MSIFSGAIFYWSNDYGISSVLALCITICLVAYKEKNNIKNMFIKTSKYIMFSFMFIIIFGSIFTGGHLKTLFNTIKGISDYQFWYYLGSKSFYIWNIDLSFPIIIQLIIILIYLIIIIKNKILSIRFIIPFFLNLCSFIASNEYKLLSGGVAREFSVFVLIYTIIYEMISLIIHKLDNKKQGSNKKNYLFICIILFTALLSTLFLIKYYKKTNYEFATRKGNYNKKLGGYLIGMNKPVSEGIDFIGDKIIFSTYASALEGITNQFQPSGYDYIIHVLGDDARKRYIDIFKKGNFSYATTIRKDFTFWEIWIENANWFFFKELYKDYIPIFATDYQVFWKKIKENNYISNSSVDIIKNPNENGFDVFFFMDKCINGTLNVELEYQIEHLPKLSSKFIFRSVIKIFDYNSLDGYACLSDIDLIQMNLPESGKYCIPVKIFGGIGKIKIISQPVDNTKIKTLKIKNEEMYFTSPNYIIVESVTLNNNEISIYNTPQNNYLLQNSSFMHFKGHKLNVVSYKNENNLIKIIFKEEVSNIKKGDILLVKQDSQYENIQNLQELNNKKDFIKKQISKERKYLLPAPITDGNWEKGVHRSANIILFLNNNNNLELLNRSTNIICFDNVLKINKVVPVDKQYIHVYVDKFVKEACYPNLLFLSNDLEE